MHAFTQLVDRCAAFTLRALEEAQQRTIENLDHSGATTLVKTLQMVELQKVISSIGMFSIFDALLQARLNCIDGFKELDLLLEKGGATDLRKKFSTMRLAINVLKHGRGTSYEKLLNHVDILPFRMKRPGENFFDEGNVSEVETLIVADDAFVFSCAEIICMVSKFLENERPDIAV